MIWVYFAVCALVITVAGTRLTRYGDALAAKTGLGGVWIGVVMVAAVTSLPELVTGISSILVADSPDIAVGDILGSCVFNLLILVLLDCLHRKDSLFAKASQDHILSAALGIVLIGFAGFNIVLGADGGGFAFGHIGLYSPAIVVMYLVSARTIYRYEARSFREPAEIDSGAEAHLSTTQIVARYSLAGIFVVIAGSLLPLIGQSIAQQMGWYESFVGTLFVAFATSLPEIVVTVAALRLGAVDMAVGNLFGSNLFNVFILSIDDLVYAKGPILQAVSQTHAVSALSATMMSATAIAALVCRPRLRVFNASGWVSLFLLCTYLVNAYILFRYGH